MDAPKLTIVAAGRGLERVHVDFDPGDQLRAWAVFKRALPAIQALDEATRHEPDPEAPSQ